MCAGLQGCDLIGITEMWWDGSLTGKKEWKDTGSLGRMGKGDEEGASPSVSMTS